MTQQPDFWESKQGDGSAGKSSKKTPDNFNYGDMPADFRKRYKQMLKKHNK